MIECDGEEHEAERRGRIQCCAARAASGVRISRCCTAPTHQARGIPSRPCARRASPTRCRRAELFDRAEIKDLCAWLRLLVNNDDDPAFLRAVTTPKRGIGHQTLQPSLGEFAAKWKTSLYEALFASLGTALNRRGRLAAANSAAT